MSVPHFADIGKAANDLLNKDYPIGQAKLDVKTTAANGVSFQALGHQDHKSGAVFAELKTKYNDPSNGLTYTQGWTTANVLTSKVELTDRVTKGVKLELNGGYHPAQGARTARVGVEYRQPGLHSRAHVDLLKGPTAHCDVVVGRDGYIVGAEVAYDVVDGRVAKYNCITGFLAKEYSVTGHALNSMSAFTVAVHHKVSPLVEVASKAHWDSRATAAASAPTVAGDKPKPSAAPVRMELGTKYKLDDSAFVKAKIDNQGRVSLGYTQTVRPGIKMSLGGQLDTSKLGENVHKFGMSVVVEQ